MQTQQTTEHHKGTNTTELLERSVRKCTFAHQIVVTYVDFFSINGNNHYS